MLVTESGHIFISNMRIHAFHGVVEQERRVGGDFVVNLKAKVDFTKALQTDCVTDTVNYAILSEIIRKEMGIPSALLEHVAGRIAKAVEDRFPQVEELTISINKCNPPMGADCDGAGVVLNLINDKTR